MTAVKRRHAWILVVCLAVLAVICLFPVSESTYEFDGFNLRTRSCRRTRCWLPGWVVRERCSPPADHSTAVRLRGLGVLTPVSERDANWVLIKGFKPGVRGWSGPGREFLQVLGPTTFGTPVAFPATQDVSKNSWVRWAVEDPQTATQFWSHYQAEVAHDWRGSRYLYASQFYLGEHGFRVSLRELESFASGSSGR